MVSKLTKSYLSLFGCGFLPRAPGTWASLATIIVFYFIHSALQTNYNVAFILVLILSVLSVPVASSILPMTDTSLAPASLKKDMDPSWIVIDEFLGQLVAIYLFYILVPSSVPVHWSHWLMAFLTFRFFDISKLWPVSYFDNLHNAFGLIFDDVIAGILAAICSFTLYQGFSYFY